MSPSSSELVRIFSDPGQINDKVDESLIHGLYQQFPIETRNFRLEVSNIYADRKYFDHNDEKKAILKSSSLTYPIKGDLTLLDKQTGKILDTAKDFSLMDSFHITGKHTLLYKGNNYTVANQLQLRPGVYTRVDNVGNLESHFNTGSGRSFKIELQRESNLFTITPDKTTSKIPIAPLLLKVFQLRPETITKYIPSEVWGQNAQAAVGKDDKYIADLYRKMVSTSKQDIKASPEKMQLQLLEALSNSNLNAQTTAITLGKSFNGINAETILLAMKNLVEVHTGVREEDNRDSLQFKRVQNLPDFLSTRFQKEHQVVKQIKVRLARELERLDPLAPKLRGNLVPKPFNKFLTNYLMNSNLVATPTETNPVESIENVAKVTVLGAGEGGISSDRGVPISARDIDASHLGIIDPSRTPESGHAGIDQRFTISARRDKEGNLYARVKDRTGAIKFISVYEMMKSVIGFPHQEGKEFVQAQVRGVLGEAKRSEVDYWLADMTDAYTITTNLVPFLNSNHPGRLTMAGKAIPQALSLVDREKPLVQSVSERGVPFVKALAVTTGTISRVAGKVEEATSEHVKIKDSSGKVVKVEAVKNMPFNMKGFHDDEVPLVKPGDTVVPGQLLFDNNYTKDGVLSLGKNLNVAYIPWKGYNHEDGLVLSKSCAESLSSHHAYKVNYEINNFSVTKKSLLNRYFPNKLTNDQLKNLDDRGFAKLGAILKKGDPVFAVLEQRELTPEDKMLGRLHKTLVTPYRLVTEEWTHDEPGKVVDAYTESNKVRFIIRSVKTLEIGDKLTGLHGNKGIVSLILPDEKMPYIKDTGKPVDILLNPASVTSRINLGQLMETAAGKIAKATGKPYAVHNFSKSSNIEQLKQELKDLNLEDSEDMVDPDTGKSLGKVLTGPQYFIKLYKTSDQNWSARNVGGYDANEQPTKGGEEGSKGVGYMEFLGLIGSNARKNLKEMTTIKSENNPEYWEKFLTGAPLPKPKTTFVTQKFLNYLVGSGVRTTLKDGTVTIAPLRDKDISALSNGKITNALRISAKNLSPEKGGLFDPTITGGLKGTKWSHYSLPEPIPNPLMERPIKSLLGLTTADFEGITRGSLGIVPAKDKDVFHIHDMTTGTRLKTVNVNSMKNRPILEEADSTEATPEEDDELSIRIGRV